MSVELHFFVPGLLPPDGLDINSLNRSSPELKLLETWLSRAEKIPLLEQACNRQLLSLSGVKWAASGDPPLAAIARLGEGAEADEHCWVAVTPAHFAAEGDQVVLYGGDDLQLNETEAQTLVKEFNQVYNPDGWFMEMRHSLRWYLKVPSQAQVQFSDYDSVIGQSIKKYLPQGQDAKMWLTRFNEIQMLFHGSALNSQRYMKGLPDINGVWLWGRGMLPNIELNWQQVWSDHVLAQGLARLSGLSSEPLPASAENCLRALPSSGAILISTTHLAQGMNIDDVAQWEARLNVFISNWIQPLDVAIKNKEIERVNLYPGGAAYFRVDASLLRRFWRGRKAIMQFT